MFDRQTTKSVTAQVLHGRDVRLVDVREDDEWQAGYMPGTHRLSLSRLDRRLHELDPDGPTLTVRRSGRRSGQVAKTSTRGAAAANVKGGLQALAQAGLR